MHCFRTAELYFRSLIDNFDILAILEHCLFEEQLGTLTSKCNNNYNCIAVSSELKTHPYCQKKRRMVALLYCGKSHFTIMLVLQKTSILTVLWEFNAISVDMILCIF